MRAKSIRALARALGCSHTALQKHETKKGKLPIESDGSYDVEKCRCVISAKADVVQPSQAGQRRSPASHNFQGGGSKSYEAYNQARTVKEVALARLKQIELRIREGELLEKVELSRAGGECLIAMKNRADSLPANLAQKLAVETDPITIELILRSEMDNLLRGFSGWLSDAT